MDTPLRDTKLPLEFDPGPLINTTREKAIFINIDHKGRVYHDFFPERKPEKGPGWYVYGRNPDYYNGIIKVCCWPLVKPRAHPHYNGRIERGWHRKRDAKAIAAFLNLQFYAPRSK